MTTEGTSLQTREPSLAHMMEVAIQQGPQGVEALERLAALMERETDRRARMAFIQALGRFHEECPPILKTRQNQQFSKVNRAGAKVPATFADLSDIDKVARPVASANGLIWTWDTVIDETHMHVTCELLHADGHRESATVHMPYESKAGASPQQKYGATQTYGMRYSLIAALGITTADEDTDGNVPGQEPEKITEAQVADLDALAVEVGADRAAFLKYMGVERMADIPAGEEYRRAVKSLEAKRKKAKKTEAAA